MELVSNVACLRVRALGLELCAVFLSQDDYSVVISAVVRLWQSGGTASPERGSFPLVF